MLLLVTGMVLALIQFSTNRSLWLDETSLALNIIDKNPYQLLQPLDYNQVAPLLFLQLEKFFSALFPNTDYGLRILPLICYLLSLFLFKQVVDLLFQNTYSKVLAISLFVFNNGMISYSNEVKQYMGDVLIALSFMFFTLKDYPKPALRYSILAPLGVLAILFSNITPIVMACCFAYLIFEWWVEKRDKMLHILITAACWGITFLSFYILVVHNHPTRDSMVEYWTKANAFLPLNPLNPELYVFLKGKLSVIFTKMMPKFILLPVLAGIGVLYLLFKRNYRMQILILLPFLLHLLLSGVKIYPFDFRLILYLCPVLILLIAYGLEGIVSKIPRFKEFEQKWILSFIIPLCFAYLFPWNRFPIQKEEIKKSLTYISKNRKESDGLYVYYGANRPYKYYTRIQFFMHPGKTFIGNESHRDDPEQYLNDFKGLKGRYWLVFSHVHGSEEDFITGKLDSLQYKKLKQFRASGSSAYLYELH